MPHWLNAECRGRSWPSCRGGPRGAGSSCSSPPGSPPTPTTVPEAVAFCRGVSVLPLEALPEESARALIDSVAQRRGASLAEALRARCVRTGNGNPFFLYELAAYSLGSATPGSLPRTLQVLLEQRLAALSGRALHVLQAIALLRPHATLARVEGVLEYSAHETLVALEELDAAGLVLVEGAGPPRPARVAERARPHDVRRRRPARPPPARRARPPDRGRGHAGSAATPVGLCRPLGGGWQPRTRPPPGYPLRRPPPRARPPRQCLPDLRESARAYARDAEQEHTLLGHLLGGAPDRGGLLEASSDHRAAPRASKLYTRNGLTMHDDDELVELDARLAALRARQGVAHPRAWRVFPLTLRRCASSSRRVARTERWRTTASTESAAQNIAATAGRIERPRRAQAAWHSHAST